MPKELIVPAAAMTLAFVLYSTGVWAERAARDLEVWHLVAFWAGLVSDGFGTLLMRRMVEAGQTTSLLHTITGTAAFALMALHAIWASWVLLRGSEQARRRFHHYSVAVWLLWLVPYLGGMAAGIAHGAGGLVTRP